VHLDILRSTSSRHTFVVYRRWYTVTDLRIGQIGHGLGPRATPSYDDSTNLRNCAGAWLHNVLWNEQKYKRL